MGEGTRLIFYACCAAISSAFSIASSCVALSSVTNVLGFILTRRGLGFDAGAPPKYQDANPQSPFTLTTSRSFLALRLRMPYTVVYLLFFSPPRSRASIITLVGCGLRFAHLLRNLTAASA